MMDSLLVGAVILVDLLLVVTTWRVAVLIGGYERLNMTKSFYINAMDWPWPLYEV